MAKSWTIGSDPAADLVVPPPASRRHCRLTIGPGGAVLEDLESDRGTFVNRVRITGAILVGRQDSITLGPDQTMPWPPEPADPGTATLTIGREPDNDLVVNLPTVSGHHARATWSGRAGEAVIEDLGSSNGTAVGRPERKVERSGFTASDTVYLGTAPVSGASILAKLDPSVGRVLSPGPGPVVVGRAPECDPVVDEPSVSGRHARLTRSGGRATIEDLKSSNGTFVNGSRIEGPTPVEPGDVVGLGLYMMRIGGVAGPPSGGVARTVAVSIPRPSKSVEDAPAGPLPASGRWPIAPLAALLIQGPIAAALVLGAAGGRFAAPESVAALVFGLGLAALWFGLSNPVILDALAPAKAWGGPLAARAGWLAAVGLGQCLIAWGIVARVGGLQGPGLASIGFLVLASLVGLALGLLIVGLAPRREAAWAALPAAFLALWLFGGGPSFPRSFPWAGAVAGAAPSRWAFEGLLLLESGRSSPDDLAEPYFPAETARMGPRADAMALAAMLVGLSASVAFLSRPSKAAS